MVMLESGIFEMLFESSKVEWERQDTDGAQIVEQSDTEIASKFRACNGIA